MSLNSLYIKTHYCDGFMTRWVHKGNSGIGKYGYFTKDHRHSNTVQKKIGYGSFELNERAFKQT